MIIQWPSLNADSGLPNFGISIYKPSINIKSPEGKSGELGYNPIFAIKSTAQVLSD